MSEYAEVVASDVKLELLSGRGIFWNDERTLFVADTHFGKEATFRHQSIPVPRGSTAGTLDRIAEMMAMTRALHLVILGDMFHARSSLSRDVRNSIDHFFSDHANVRFTLVRGNHDVRVGKLPSTWPVEIVEPGTQIGKVVLGHYPTEVPPDAALLLYGHLHPAIQIGNIHDRIKLPCFWLSNRQLVLPAIGEFTGTHVVRPRGEDQVWAVSRDSIFSIRRRRKG